jgi:hypothetical protein
MSRVNWEAKSEYEYVQNYKLLQVAFKKHNIQRYVDVPKLIRAKYQDNLEFCRWLKAFFDQSGSHREDYDPIAARAKGKGVQGVNQLLTKTSSNYNSKPIPTSSGTRQTAAAAKGSAPRAAAVLGPGLCRLLPSLVLCRKTSLELEIPIQSPMQSLQTLPSWKRMQNWMQRLPNWKSW